MKSLNDKSPFLPLLIILVLFGFILVERLVVPQQPYGSDPMAYAVIAHEMLDGRSLYSDLWDHKPPAIFVSYLLAEAAVGYGPQSLALLNITVTFITLLGVYWAGAFRGVAAGLWAAVLWAILSGSHALEGREPNTEIFINACLIWAFAILVRTDPHPLGAKRAVAVGCLFAIGSFYKPVVVACAAVLACVHVLFRPQQSNDRRQVMIDVVVIALVGLVGWGALFGYFAGTDRLTDFQDAIITYNRHYAGNPISNLIAPMKGTAELAQDFLTPLALLAVAGAVWTFQTDRRIGALLMAYAASSWIMIALPGKFYPHYYQLWLPPLVLGTGFFIEQLTRLRWQIIRWFAHALGAVLILFFFFKELPFYQTARAGDWTPVVDPPHRAAESTGRWLNSILMPEETFFVWGGGPGPYFWSGRRPPAGVFYNHHLLDGPLASQLSSRVAEDIARERPELLVMPRGGTKAPQWLTENYQELKSDQGEAEYTFYALRNGRLVSQQ